MPCDSCLFCTGPEIWLLRSFGQFGESSVVRSVDKLFSLETLGVVEDPVSDYDWDKIALFSNSISYRDNCYYADLSWNDGKLPFVASNNQVALNVLDRVVTRLSKINLYKDYCQVFLDQEGIIEKIQVDPGDFSHYTWIPHRPVVKMNDQLY